MVTTVVLVLILGVCIPRVAGHGYIIDPPGRSSMWRVGFNTPINYNDNQLFCGGAYVENTINHGKCGVCGDPWNGPRHNEAGGKYATGTIAKTYKSGQSVTIGIIVTANHVGWFEFKLCPNNNPKKAITQECLDSHVLQQTNGRGSKYFISRATGRFNIRVRLPQGLTCTQCVLQWRWHTGNSWGYDENGRGCLGCGLQEEFYGCSDIAITEDGNQIKTAHPPTTTVKAPPFVNLHPFKPIVTKPPHQPENSHKPIVNGPQFKPITSTAPITEAPSVNQGKRCYAVNNWAGIPTLDRWCVLSCSMGRCPAIYCRCD